MSIKFRTKTVQGFTVDSIYKPFTYPAGEAHIKVEGPEVDASYHLADIRGYNPQDFNHLAMWTDRLFKDQPGGDSVVFLPYLPGARADRGHPFGAAFFAYQFATLPINQIITIDPHSPVWESQYKKFSDPNCTTFTIFPFERIIKREIQDGSSDSRPRPYVGVVAPDKGAVDRASRAAKVMGVPVYRAEKRRDEETGQLSGFHMIDVIPDEGRLLLVDDICDGGGTFIGLADELGLGPDRLDLWITHGIFSKGFDNLSERFGTIHTTDSYYRGTREKGPNFVQVHSITPYLTEAVSV